MQLLRAPIFVVTLALTIGAVVAQESHESISDISQSRTIYTAPETTLKRVATFLKGSTPEDGLLLMPVGWHPRPSLAGDSLTSVNLIALSKKSLIGGTFNNSFGDRVWFIGVNRTLLSKNRFGLDYSAGLMVGYKGNLANSIKGPLSPLYEGHVNPYFAIAPYYRMSERLEARLLAAPPNIVVFGLKYLF